MHISKNFICLSYFDVVHFSVLFLALICFDFIVTSSFSLVFARYILFHLFIFNFSILDMSYKQRGFNLIFKTQSDNILLLSGEFTLVPLNIINDVSIITHILFCTFHLSRSISFSILFSYF